MENVLCADRLYLEAELQGVTATLRDLFNNTSKEIRSWRHHKNCIEEEHLFLAEFFLELNKHLNWDKIFTELHQEVSVILTQRLRRFQEMGKARTLILTVTLPDDWTKGAHAPYVFYFKEVEPEHFCYDSFELTIPT